MVLPASASWCEAEGTVTNSERRVQRVRKALDPPGEARDDILIVRDLAARMGADWGYGSAEDVWNEVRSLSPMHRGMTYARLEELGGIQWPCPDEQDPGRAVPARPPVGGAGGRAGGRRSTSSSRSCRSTSCRTSSRSGSPPAAGSTRTTPASRAAATARRCDAASRSTSRPRTAPRWAWPRASSVQITSRRGSVTAPVRVDTSLRPGLAFMTLHFPDEVETNVLTIDATDPKSGTAEFKASAIRVEKLPSAAAVAR